MDLDNEFSSEGWENVPIFQRRVKILQDVEYFAVTVKDIKGRNKTKVFNIKTTIEEVLIWTMKTTKSNIPVTANDFKITDATKNYMPKRF